MCDTNDRALTAEKEARSSAAVLAAGEHPRATQADILIVDNETSAQEQAKQELAAAAADKLLQAPAPAGGWAEVGTDSPAAELAAELARLPDESITAEELDEEEEDLPAQKQHESLAEEPLVEGSSSAFPYNHDNGKVIADGAPLAGAHSEPLYAARSSFGEPLHAAAAAAAAEVTIVTQELLNEAFHTEQLDNSVHPTDAREVREEGSVSGAAQGAAAGSMDSTFETAERCTPGNSPEADGSTANADAAAVQAVIESLLATETDSAAAAHEAADMQPSNAATAEQGDEGVKESDITAEDQQFLANLALAGGAAAIDGITGYLNGEDARHAAHAPAAAEEFLTASVTLDRLISNTHVTQGMPQSVSAAANEGAVGEDIGLTGQVLDREQQGLLQSHAADTAEHVELPPDSPISTAPSLAAAEQPRTDNGVGSTILEAMELTGHDLVLPVNSLISAEEPGMAYHGGEAKYTNSIPPHTPVLASQLETGSLADGFSGEAEPALEDFTDAAAAAEEAEAKISINLQPRLEWRVNAEITLQQPDAVSTPQRNEPVERPDVTNADGSAASVGMESSHHEGVPAADTQLIGEAIEAEAADQAGEGLQYLLLPLGQWGD